MALTFFWGWSQQNQLQARRLTALQTCLKHRRSPAWLSMCDLLTVTSHTSHESDCWLMEDVRSVIPGRLLGTLSLTISKTTQSLSTFRRWLNISNSHSTGAHSELVWGYFTATKQQHAIWSSTYLLNKSMTGYITELFPKKEQKIR